MINAAWVLACVVVVAWGLFRYWKAEGDGKREKVAFATIVGGVAGLAALVAGILSVVVVFNDAIYGGPVVDRDYMANVDWDAVLRAQVQKSVNLVGEHSAGRMIQAIQNQKSGCLADDWMCANFPSETGGALAMVVGKCGLTMPTGSVKRVLDATAGVSSFGRVGGSIVMAFDTGVATHLTEKDNCWVYDAGSQEWYVGGNS